jgi:predicted alpha/beta-hydrolase family hydrolase
LKVPFCLPSLIFYINPTTLVLGNLAERYFFMYRLRRSANKKVPNNSSHNIQKISLDQRIITLKDQAKFLINSILKAG